MGCNKTYTQSFCMSCKRSNPKPDPYGCAFHRWGHYPVYDEAITKMVTNSHGAPYPVIVVTKCKYYENGTRRALTEEEVEMVI